MSKGKHWMHHGTGTRLYNCWQAMRNRASGKHSVNSRKWYLDKGIIVCEEWQTDFIAFRDWSLQHGYDDFKTLDRIYSCRGYNPNNCEWVSLKENVRRAKQDIWRRIDNFPIEALWGDV
jgi:hypothetical protein